MSALAERIHFPHNSRTVCKYAAVAGTALLLAYYCRHPELYDGEKGRQLLGSARTYVTAAVSVLIIAFLLIPNRLSIAKNRTLSWCWFAAAPFAIYFSLLYLNADKFNIDFWKLNKIALLFTFLFLYLVQGILYGITGSIRWSVIITAVAVALLGIANCFVISFRGMALSGADLFSIKTAMTVASEYTYEPDWYIYTEILCTFAICVVSLKLKGGRMIPLCARAAMLAGWLIAAGGFFHICCRTDFLENHDIRPYGFTHQLRYKQYDMLFTTLTTCFGLVVEKPEGYSVERVKEISKPYVGAAGGTSTPNIIVLMNESFADYTDIGAGLTLSEDCMPFIHSLSKNTIKGNAYASIFGGNTPNSEYEFLTGNTMAFLPPSTVGFNLFVRGDMPSLASQMKEEGYETAAFHPYRGYNYRRHIVYPQIGFDAYYTRDDFKYPKLIRNYVSDESLAERIIEEYDKNRESGKKFFGYGVTIQNHGGYYSSNTRNLEDRIKVADGDTDQGKAEIYVNLIRKSDEMFQSLVEHFEQEKEPVVILMFGDHQANLGEDTYNHLIGAEEDCTQEELMEKYKVPFVLWANYDIGEETIEKTSLNYLSSLIAERLGLPMTGYQRYLTELQKKIPVINALGYWGDDGKFYDLEDASSPYSKLLDEYRILEYNYIFGKKNRYLPMFTMAGG